MKYMIKCSVGEEGYHEDYSGIEHTDYDEALKELNKANADNEQFGFINYAYIKEIEE